MLFFCWLTLDLNNSFKMFGHKNCQNPIQSDQDLSFKVFFGSPFTIANLIQFDIFILKKNTF